MASKSPPTASEALPENEEISSAKAKGPEGLLWRPADVTTHQIEQLRKKINAAFGTNLSDYHSLHRWSVNHYSDFWGVLWDHFAVIRSVEANVVVEDKPINEIPRWFPGARLNYAENLLRFPDDQHVALYYTSERKNEVGIQSKTFGALRTRVAQFASALRAAGVGKGDRVVGYIPNIPEAIEAMTAVASIGAIWSSTSPDFGVSGVLDRFRQIRPKVIFSVEAVSYNMKIHDHLGKLSEVVRGLDLEKVVVIPFCHEKKDISIDAFGPKAVFLDDFLSGHSGERIDFEPVPFDHPLFIMYSSGTTGAPKCIVHGHGGTLMKHLEEHVIQGNRTADDVLLYYTTTGWMMWNWMVTALAVGTTLVLYDGSPLHPNAAAMWDLVDECGITVFGTSAKWIAVQEDRGVKPRATHKLETLKAICSTGSPLKPHSYDYVYRDIKPNVLLASISGGTDIIACFMGENSTLPVHRGEIQSFHLGCAIECWDDENKHVEGEAGELVCTKPFPSMPVAFWNDPEGHLYHAAYFDKIPGVWAHGDFIHVDPKTKGIVMLGRSDGTLNPNGVRFGSAEIYNIVERFSEVADSVCVGQRSPADGEERVILFLKMAAGEEFGEDLVKRIRVRIRSELSARHVPALVLPVADIPYTVNGKKVEVAIKKILNGKEVKNEGALANPRSLELYKNIPETTMWG